MSCKTELSKINLVLSCLVLKTYIAINKINYLLSGVPFTQVAFCTTASRRQNTQFLQDLTLLQMTKYIAFINARIHQGTLLVFTISLTCNLWVIIIVIVILTTIVHFNYNANKCLFYIWIGLRIVILVWAGQSINSQICSLLL